MPTPLLTQLTRRRAAGLLDTGLAALLLPSCAGTPSSSVESASATASAAGMPAAEGATQ